MRLLVSVADANDARAALDGGADIIDAKDPSRGPLGAVSPATLAAIREVVGSRRPTSAALGDARDEKQIERDARDVARAGVTFVKVGFGGITSVARAGVLLAAAVRGANAWGGTDVVAVAYADARRAATVPSETIPEIAARAGAVGVLLDTVFKDRGGLFDCLRTEVVGGWVRSAQSAGLLVSLAGRLDGAGLRRAYELGADIGGVRGAACDGGRAGRVSAARVRSMVALLSPRAGVALVDHSIEMGDIGRRQNRDTRSAW